MYKSLFYILLLLSTLAFSQKIKAQASISGTIKGLPEKEGLAYATAYIVDIEMGVSADENGNFVFKKLSGGQYTIQFQMIGYQQIEKKVKLGSNEAVILEIFLQPTSLGLAEVSVVAKENQNSMATSSVIDAQAVEHIQATNLGDVLQLLPGQVLKNTDLNSSQQASLRITSGNASEDQINAMGVSIVVDGAPVSNDANMQITNTSESGATTTFSSTVGGGTDMREIPADNIESVEVIKGIPSAKHGNLTSGVILVTPKTGRMPLTGKIKFNATSVMGYVGKGMKLGEKSGTLNLDFDYAYSQEDIRTTVPSYSRFTGKIAHTNSWFNNLLTTNNSLQLSHTYDKDEDDKDAVSGEERYSKNTGIRFNSSGKINANKSLISKLDYNVALSYTKQESYLRSLYSGSVKPLTTAVNDTTMEVSFMPSEYLSGVYIKGKPFDLFASLSSLSLANTGSLKHKILLGAEWTTTANFGEGRYYDENYYPSSSVRPRKFSDIPALNQLSFYAEDLIITNLFGNELKMQLGARFENIQPESLAKGEFGQTLMPRTNFSYQLIPDLKLRVGYGQTAKTPSLVYLYPDYAYADAVSFQQYSSDYSDESMVVMTTKVFNTENKNLVPAVMTKYEGGFDLEHNKLTFNFTGYYEKLENGYSFIDVLSVNKVPTYNVYFYLPGYGSKPQLDYVNVDTSIVRNTYKKPVNNLTIIKKGFEFTFNTGRIKSLGATLNVTGAFTNSTTSDASPDIYLNSQYFSGNDNGYIGIYRSNGSKATQFLTTFMYIQHIPKLKFLATITMQVSWYYKKQSIINKEIPIGYYDEEGNEYLFTESDDVYNNYAYLIRTLDESSFQAVTKPTFWFLNLRLTKEINEQLRFSFYANNMFMNNPYYDDLTSGTRSKLNPNLSFGGELSIRF